jgi:hypothetical protein
LGEAQVEARAHTVEYRPQWSDGPMERRRRLQRQRPVRQDSQRQVDRSELDRAQLLVRRQRDVQPAAPGHPQPAGRAPLQTEVDRAFDVGVCEQAADEAIRVRCADLEREAVDVRERQRVDGGHTLGNPPIGPEAEASHDVGGCDRKQSGSTEHVERARVLVAVEEPAQLSGHLARGRLKLERKWRRHPRGHAAGQPEIRRDSDAPLIG